MRITLLKSVMVLLTCTFSLSNLFAQSPQKMSYQAVIRNNSGVLVTGQGVGMQISILNGTTPVYVEKQTTTTNTNGLVTIEIGAGSVVSGTFSTIDWSVGEYSIKTETDPTSAGGTTYTITGTSKLLSVPYALNAKTVETINELDPTYTTSQAAYITADDITNLSNLSNTNTGDETTATIKEKLDITTLSGSNTGDQILPTLSSLGAVAGNTAITGATNTKITYDSKGLVISGTSATTADIAASTNKNYVTDAQQIVISNTSNTNTGDQILPTLSSLGAVAGNTAITGATNTKITYDAKGLVTSGTSATTADIAASTNKNYVTDAEKTAITHTNKISLDLVSGSNTGDNAVNTLYSGLSNYTHPSSDGNLHIIATSTTNNGKVLTAGATAGSLSWTTPATGTVTAVTGTSPIVSSGGTAPTISISAATTSAAGSMSAADKTKLDGIGNPLTIGQIYQGGKIFWLDASGQHGLIAATTDVSTGATWYNGANITTTAIRNGIGAGMINTERIIAKQSTGAYAANICANRMDGGYGDWYLPSAYELDLLYDQKDLIGGFTTSLYWSSSEDSSTNASYLSFSNGFPGSDLKSNAFYVRIIRAF